MRTRYTVLFSIGLAALLPAVLVQAHDDVVGTRFVAPEGVDTGDCDENHAPCRTLLYALTQVDPGDAIKLAAGRYDVSSIDVENLLLGKEGVRGGYSARGSLRDPETPRPIARCVSGVPDAFRNNFIAHGFTVVDANDDAAAAHHRAASCSRPRPARPASPATSPVTTSISSRRCSCRRFRRRRSAPAICGASSISTTTANTRCSGIATARRCYDVTVPGAPVLVGNVPGNQSLWREVKVYQVRDPNTRNASGVRVRHHRSAN